MSRKYVNHWIIDLRVHLPDKNFSTCDTVEPLAKKYKIASNTVNASFDFAQKELILIDALFLQILHWKRCLSLIVTSITLVHTCPQHHRSCSNKLLPLKNSMHLIESVKHGAISMILVSIGNFFLDLNHWLFKFFIWRNVENLRERPRNRRWCGRINFFLV